MVDAQTANVTDKQQLINKVSKTDMQIQCSFKAQKLDPRLTKHQKHGQKISKKIAREQNLGKHRRNIDQTSKTSNNVKTPRALTKQTMQTLPTCVTPFLAEQFCANFGAGYVFNPGDF